MTYMRHFALLSCYLYILFPCIETLWTRLLKFSLSQISPEIENVITKQARPGGEGEEKRSKHIFTLSDDLCLGPGNFIMRLMMMICSLFE